MFRKKTVTILALTLIAVFFYTLHHLLVYLPSTETYYYENPSELELGIYEELNRLSDTYKTAPYSRLGHVDLFLGNIKNVANPKLSEINLKKLWEETDSWPSNGQLTNISSASIGSVFYALKHARIIKADIDTRGTQLKLLLTLSGGQQCVFKPKWFDINKIIEGPVYAGKDRFGSEIVAFYLSVLLNMPLVPITVQRTVSLKHEILPVATKKLQNTSFVRGNNTCVYGKCFYCKKQDPICDDERDELVGSVILNVKRTFSNYRSPWQRTYKKGKSAPWEDDLEYCNRIVKSKLPKKRMLDLIDTAIFDFLIQNGDRHHYETFNDTVIWLDNGKGLGNPYKRHLDILAPLYQCCVVRGKTWKALLNLTEGNLSKYLKLMPDIESVLTEAHLKAMESRLPFIFAAIEYCRKRKEDF